MIIVIEHTEHTEVMFALFGAHKLTNFHVQIFLLEGIDTCRAFICFYLLPCMRLRNFASLEGSK